jgi:hypothetical protein
VKLDAIAKLSHVASQGGLSSPDPELGLDVEALHRPCLPIGLFRLTDLFGCALAHPSSSFTSITPKTGRTLSEKA